MNQNHSKLRPLLVALVLIQLAWVQSCGFSRSHSSSEHHARSNFTDETETRLMTLDVRSAMTSVDLRVQVALMDGALTWTLMDPDGDVRWEEEVVAPARRNESRAFEPIVGEWTLEVSLEEATGGYDILWQASD